MGSSVKAAAAMIFLWASMASWGHLVASNGPADGGQPASSPSRSKDSGRTPIPPSGFSRDGSVRSYWPDTLFEAIDGDADLYLKAGFIRLDTHLYVNEGQRSEWFEVFLYRMAGHRSAFSVFSQRRSRDAVAETLTAFSYRYARNLFFVHGPYYVEILAEDPTDRTVEAMDEWAKGFVKVTAVSSEDIPELEWLPGEGLVQGSETLHLRGAFGFDGFEDLFSARYDVRGGQATAFFQICPSPSAAARLADGYRTFLLEYGGEAVSMESVLPNGRLIRILGRFAIIYTRGSAVAGVQDAGSAEVAALLVRHLNESLPL
jgi:hypothetical protein